jgi:tRNA nucleotidyltransferase (CCA-adding enzyme)
MPPPRFPAPPAVVDGRADLRPPPEVVRIARRLEEAGFSTWAVGGAVRDALSGGRPGDWDLTTAARPEAVRRIFPRTVPVGISHGTVGVVGKDGRMYEVTTFRRDVETDGRHARVSFSDTVDEDLERRDFTMNAVAWHPLTGEVRDPHGGVPDLRAGVLRTVGPAEDRFREDRLRVLRALRFAGRFGLRIDAGTWEAARVSAPALGALSAERVREELVKVLREVEPPSVSLRLYERAGVLAALYPELQACVGVVRDGGDVWSRLLAAMDAVPRPRTLLRVAALLHDAAPGGTAASAALARGVMGRLRFSNAETDRVVHLVAQHASFPDPEVPAPALRRWLRRIGREHLRDAFRLRAALLRGRGAGADERRGLARLWRRARAELAAGVPLEVGELAIGGRELRALGIAPGPSYGRILRALLERVADDPALNVPERLMALAAEASAREGRGDASG